MSAMRSPKASDEDKALFRSLVPDDERVTIRPMFGSLAAFVNGQMSMGLHADTLMVRLAEADREQARATGSAVFEPMPGRPMRAYVTVPDWRADQARVDALAAKALEYALSLPPKTK